MRLTTICLACQGTDEFLERAVLRKATAWHSTCFAATEVYRSVASVWEAVIKHGLGKLPLVSPPADYLPQQREAHGIASLPVDEGAMPPLASLPPLHRDPFDRLLVAQALQHGLTVATVDPADSAYAVPLLPTT